jgi:hypothetical protein
MRRGIEKASRSRFVLIGLAVTLQVTLTVAVIAAFQYYDTNAAPASVSACVNKYTGAVRMSPNGVTTCNANETPVNWSAVDTDTHGVGETVEGTNAVNIPGLGAAGDIADCPTGFVATGGGFANSGGPDVILRSSHVSSDGAGWYVEAYNPSAVSHYIGIWVVCARP